MASAAPAQAFFGESILREAIHSKSSDRSFEYIIAMNNELHSKFAKVSAELIVAESQCEDLETEVDQITKSRNLLTGYLKNDIEVARNMKLINEKLQATSQSSIVSMHLVLFVGLVGLIVYGDAINLSIRCFVCACVGFCIVRYDCWFRKEVQEINDIHDAIKKVDMSNERIWDLIDNL